MSRCEEYQTATRVDEFPRGCESLRDSSVYRCSWHLHESIKGVHLLPDENVIVWDREKSPGKRV